MLLSSRRTSILVPFAARRSGASIELVEVREAVGEAEAAAPLDGLVAVGHHAQEAVLVRRLGMGGDKGALALAPHDDVLGGELVDRLAHRALAHAEARGELDLRRDGLAGLPLARNEALREQDLDLLI